MMDGLAMVSIATCSLKAKSSRQGLHNTLANALVHI